MTCHAEGRNSSRRSGTPGTPEKERKAGNDNMPTKRMSKRVKFTKAQKIQLSVFRNRKAQLNKEIIKVKMDLKKAKLRRKRMS